MSFELWKALIGSSGCNKKIGEAVESNLLEICHENILFSCFLFANLVLSFQFSNKLHIRSFLSLKVFVMIAHKRVLPACCYCAI